MTARFLRLCLSCLIALVCLGANCAQGFAYRADTPVYITASLTDKNGIYIEDLTPDEVQIFENGQPRKIEFMAGNQIPVVYGLIFDLSMLPENEENDYRGSMLTISSATSARSIAYELIDKFLGRQTIWVAGYDKEFHIVQDSTTDGFAAKAAIQRMHSERDARDAFLYSALVGAIMKMNGRTEKRRVIIVFLDSLDPQTTDKMKPLESLLSASNVELFVVSFAGKLGSGRGGLPPALSASGLKTLSTLTAGDAFLAADYRDHYEDLVRRLYNQIRTLYTFGFTSESGSAKPSRLEVRCRRTGAKVQCHSLVSVLP